MLHTPPPLPIRVPTAPARPPACLPRRTRWRQAGIMDNKTLAQRAQKASLYGWFGGSLCTIVLEIYELAGELAPSGGEVPCGQQTAAAQPCLPARSRSLTHTPLPPIALSLAALSARQAGESDADYRARLGKQRPELARRLTVLVHALFQAALAMGLLELRPWKPRTVGALGIIASAMNCYMLYPAVPGSLLAGLLSLGGGGGGGGGKPAAKVA